MESTKGFHSVIQPVVEEFKERGVILSTATPDSPVLREDMGDFYRSNHALICASQHEGGATSRRRISCVRQACNHDRSRALFLKS